MATLIGSGISHGWLVGWYFMATYTRVFSLTYTHITRYCLRKKYYSEICNIVFSLFNSGQSILLLESFLEEIERDRIISFLKKSKLQISIFQKLELKICYYILIVNWKENDSSILIFSWKRDKKNIAKFLI